MHYVVNVAFIEKYKGDILEISHICWQQLEEYITHDGRNLHLPNYSQLHSFIYTVKSEMDNIAEEYGLKLELLFNKESGDWLLLSVIDRTGDLLCCYSEDLSDYDGIDKENPKETLERLDLLSRFYELKDTSSITDEDITSSIEYLEKTIASSNDKMCVIAFKKFKEIELEIALSEQKFIEKELNADSAYNFLLIKKKRWAEKGIEGKETPKETLEILNLEKDIINTSFNLLSEFYESKKEIERKIKIYNSENETEIKILYEERLEDITSSIEILEIASSNDKKKLIWIEDIISGKKKKPKLTAQTSKKILENVKRINNINLQEVMQKDLASHLSHIESIRDLLATLSTYDEDECSKNYINNLSNHELVEKVSNFSENIEKHINTSVFERNPYIAEIAKRRAKGVCQLCEKPSPFNDKQGKPYLEEHHIVWLSKGGQDSIDNVIALCPNCHAKMHNSFVDEFTLEKLKEKAQERLT